MSTTAQYQLSAQRPFTLAERSNVTVLCGGLTAAHERLVEAGLRTLGYQAQALPTPDIEAYDCGRTHCSNGLCNPAYFTIGNLLKYLRHEQTRRDLSASEICDQYVFYTAGAKGPCRFGMYESEYRFALKSAGYDRFRVLVFQQQDGISQTGKHEGLAIDAFFYLVHVKSFLLGDVVNELYHRLKPYEVVAGACDRARDRVIEDLCLIMSPPAPNAVRRVLEKFNSTTRFKSLAQMKYLQHLEGLLLFADELRATKTQEKLREAVQHYARVEVDRLQVKPVVKVTGEFWAQTTEGDGNFRIFEQLEQRDAEVLTEPISTWMHYLLHGAQRRQLQHRGIANKHSRNFVNRQLSSVFSHVYNPLHVGALRLVQKVLTRTYAQLCHTLEHTVHELIDQDELERLGAPYYNPDIRGGEGHLEVGKTLYYTQHRLAHMVLAVKPFGCMPSTMSDAVQSLLQSQHPELLFLPVETAADGRDQALTRVEVLLTEARRRARAEWQESLSACVYSLQQVRDYVQHHPALRSGLMPLPDDTPYTSTAARYLSHVAALMRADMHWQRRHEYVVTQSARYDSVATIAHESDGAGLSAGGVA